MKLYLLLIKWCYQGSKMKIISGSGIKKPFFLCACILPHWFKVQFPHPCTSQTHLHIICLANELQKAMRYMKYFIIYIFASIPLLCVMLCWGMEYQVAVSSDQPSLQGNLSCLSISIHCVWTALGELHLKFDAYVHAQLTMIFDANDVVSLIESRHWICTKKAGTGATRARQQ